MNILRDMTEDILLYQQAAWDKISGGYKGGEKVIYSGGRGGGKSLYYSIPRYPKTTASLNRLMPKYKFSRAKWHIVDYDWKDFVDVSEWCVEQFGPQPLNPDAWCRWYQRGMGRIHFRDEQDAMMFILRWA